MRAKVVEAEAEVPKAMAAALREGKIGVMDYYHMRNIMADTEMRNLFQGWAKKLRLSRKNKTDPVGGVITQPSKG